MAEPRELIGRRVVIQNPSIQSARWEGKAIGYAAFPTIDLEMENGHRISLPAAWARLAPDTDTPPGEPDAQSDPTRELYINSLRVSWGTLDRRDRRRLWRRHPVLAIALRKLLDEGRL